VIDKGAAELLQLFDVPVTPANLTDAIAYRESFATEIRRDAATKAWNAATAWLGVLSTSFVANAVARDRYVRTITERVLAPQEGET